MQRSIGWHTDALRMRAQGKGADEIAAHLAFSQQYQRPEADTTGETIRRRPDSVP